LLHGKDKPRAPENNRAREYSENHEEIRRRWRHKQDPLSWDGKHSVSVHGGFLIGS
jgi:hypothetical protein